MSAGRDYSLVGPEAASAVERGLEAAEWYRSPLPRVRMKQLMKRRNGPAVRDTAIWLGLLAVAGVVAWWSWGTWWMIPAFAVYGVLYGSVSDSRWHECGHGTAFATQWMNTVVYHLASFMAFREAVSWRWSHARHHSDTIIVGLDPEIAFPRPTRWWTVLAELFGLKSVAAESRKIALNVIGRTTAEERTYLPESQFRRAFWTSRVYAMVLVAVVAWSLAAWSIMPLMFIGLPTLYGRWLLVVFGATQHAGLAEDVLDHRLNSRTVMMNPVLRFLYWNMNYHVEHHMYPTVPFHSLPQLHEEVRDDMPPAYTGIIHAYREIIPALRRQAEDPSFFVERPLPVRAGTPTDVGAGA
jgi:fatty acid desaturase